MVNILGINIGGKKAPVVPAPNVEEGINAMVDGILMAVNYIATNGQNVTNAVNAPYWNVAAQPPTNYAPSDGRVVHRDNTEVHHGQQTIVVPEARSSFDPAEWDASVQNADQQTRQSLDQLVIQPRTSIANALRQLADDAGLRKIAQQQGIAQAMQTVEQLVNTLNITGNMRSKFRPNELYDTLRLFTNLIELMRPQAAAGAQVQQAHQLLFANLQQRLTANQFLTQRTQHEQYTLPAQMGAAVILTQYAIR